MDKLCITHMLFWCLTTHRHQKKIIFDPNNNTYKTPKTNIGILLSFMCKKTTLNINLLVPQMKISHLLHFISVRSKFLSTNCSKHPLRNLERKQKREGNRKEKENKKWKQQWGLKNKENWKKKWFRSRGKRESKIETQTGGHEVGGRHEAQKKSEKTLEREGRRKSEGTCRCYSCLQMNTDTRGRLQIQPNVTHKKKTER